MCTVQFSWGFRIWGRKMPKFRARRETIGTPTRGIPGSHFSLDFSYAYTCLSASYLFLSWLGTIKSFWHDTGAELFLRVSRSFLHLPGPANNLKHVGHFAPRPAPKRANMKFTVEWESRLKTTKLRLQRFSCYKTNWFINLRSFWSWCVSAAVNQFVHFLAKCPISSF